MCRETVDVNVNFQLIIKSTKYQDDKSEYSCHLVDIQLKFKMHPNKKIHWQYMTHPIHNNNMIITNNKIAPCWKYLLNISETVTIKIDLNNYMFISDKRTNIRINSFTKKIKFSGKISQQIS